MTTIAVDREMIAWDTQITFGNERMTAKAKKVRVIDGVIFAMCGEYGRFESLIDWWKNGAEDAKAPKGSWDFLVIESPTQMRLYGPNTQAGIPLVPPVTMGTGDQFAMGRLAAPGASAKDAVKAAFGRDIYTGGSIRTLRFDKVWPTGKKRNRAKSK